MIFISFPVDEKKYIYKSAINQRRRTYFENLNEMNFIFKVLQKNPHKIHKIIQTKTEYN